MFRTLVAGERWKDPFVWEYEGMLQGHKVQVLVQVLVLVFTEVNRMISQQQPRVAGDI